VVLVAIEDGTILGTVTYVSDHASPYAEKQRHGEASIRMLSVAPEHQRRGVGRDLTVACIDRARVEGKRAIVLHADETMDASKRLYQTLGFRRDPSRDYRPDAATLLICYVLEL
jgi:ribosomal protein S18 acetylase RimI-like enzyme